jgi:hypothetical protein
MAQRSKDISVRLFLASISARSNDYSAPNRPIGAILSLYQDVNGDKVLSNDELIKTVTASSTSGLVSLSVGGLGDGRYFAKVVWNNTTTFYLTKAIKYFYLIIPLVIYFHQPQQPV